MAGLADLTRALALAAALSVPLPARADGIAVGVSGTGRPMFLAGGQPFSPRGVNYVRLAHITWNGIDYGLQHNTFNPAAYDAARLAAALLRMRHAGYTTVRFTLDNVYLWGQGQNLVVPGISADFRRVLIDALTQVAAQNMTAMLAIVDLPKNYLPSDRNNEFPKINPHYTPTLPVTLTNNPEDPDQAWGDNKKLFDPVMALSFAQFWSDLLRALPQPQRNAVFAIDIFDEAHANLRHLPFSATSVASLIRPFQGTGYIMFDYDLASRFNRQALLDAAAISFVGVVRTAVANADPAMLLTMSVTTPLQVGHRGYDALRASTNGHDDYPVSLDALRRSAVSFYDVHEYPYPLPASFSTAQDLESAGLSRAAWPDKPILMSELGAIVSVYPDAHAAGQDIAQRMMQACAYGFSGSVFWNWEHHRDAEHHGCGLVLRNRSRRHHQRRDLPGGQARVVSR